GNELLRICVGIAVCLEILRNAGIGRGLILWDETRARPWAVDTDGIAHPRLVIANRPAFVFHDVERLVRRPELPTELNAALIDRELIGDTWTILRKTQVTACGLDTIRGVSAHGREVGRMADGVRQSGTVEDLVERCASADACNLAVAFVGSTSRRDLR